MRFVSRLAIYVGLTLCLAAPTHAQVQVGTIETLLGFVEIDAYGTGEFIPARNGEHLFESSVIRTDVDSWADLNVGGRPATIPPLSTVRVSSFIRTRSPSSVGFLGRLIDGIRSFLRPEPESEEEYADRAENRADAGPGIQWELDVDPGEAYEKATAAMEVGDYRTAVQELRSIEEPYGNPIFTLEEYYVRLTYALAELGSHEAALQAAFEYLAVEPSPTRVSGLPRSLQLLCALSAFVITEDDIARASVDTYLHETPLSEASPQAVMVKAYFLRLDRRSREAQDLVNDAMRANPDADWATLGAM
jgi:tetratricopeptide (TPR) repeat protein